MQCKSTAARKLLRNGDKAGTACPLWRHRCSKENTDHRVLACESHGKFTFGGPMLVLVMGVAGSGKTLIGSMLAQALGCTFADADEFHPAANIEKMSRGIPLTDAD